MLSPSDIDKLCRGRIIKASFYNSANDNSAGPHYAVILDSDEQIAESDEYYVAVISNNDQIDKTFIVPVPARTGLTGVIVCSWLTSVALAGITEVGEKLLPPEMLPVNQMIHRYQLRKSKR